MRSLEWTSVFDTEISNITKQSALLNSQAFMGGGPKEHCESPCCFGTYKSYDITPKLQSIYQKLNKTVKICEKEILSYVAIGKLLLTVTRTRRPHTKIYQKGEC